MTESVIAIYFNVTQALFLLRVNTLNYMGQKLSPPRSSAILSIQRLPPNHRSAFISIWRNNREGSEEDTFKTNAEKTLRQMKDLKKVLRTCDPVQAKQLLQRFIHRIEVDKASKTAFVRFWKIPLIDDSVKDWLESVVTVRFMPEVGTTPNRLLIMTTSFA